MNAGLLRSPGGDHLGVDDLQRLGVVAALEIEQLVVGAVDMSHLASVQADPNASRRATALIVPVPHDDVEIAIAATRLVEGDDALAANRGENGLVRSHRSQFCANSSARAGRLNPPRTTSVPTAANLDSLLRANMMNLLYVWAQKYSELEGDSGSLPGLALWPLSQRVRFLLAQPAGPQAASRSGSSTGLPRTFSNRS